MHQEVPRERHGKRPAQAICLVERLNVFSHLPAKPGKKTERITMTETKGCVLELSLQLSWLRSGLNRGAIVQNPKQKAWYLAQVFGEVAGFVVGQIGDDTFRQDQGFA